MAKGGGTTRSVNSGNAVTSRRRHTISERRSEGYLSQKYRELSGIGSEQSRVARKEFLDKVISEYGNNLTETDYLEAVFNEKYKYDVKGMGTGWYRNTTESERELQPFLDSEISNLAGYNYTVYSEAIQQARREIYGKSQDDINKYLKEHRIRLYRG